MSRRARTAALKAVADAESVVAKWEAKTTSVQAEIDRLRASMGEAVLEDEGHAEELPRRLRELRDQLETAQRAATAAQPKLAEARAVALEEAAQEFDHEAKLAREVLDQHNAETARRLKELEDHEGPYVPRAKLDAALASNSTTLVMSETPDKTPPKTARSVGLRNAVQIAELRADLIRDVAAGRNPDDRLAAIRDSLHGNMFGLPSREIYPPAIWGPEAIVPAPAYLRALG